MNYLRTIDAPLVKDHNKRYAHLQNNSGIKLVHFQVAHHLDFPFESKHLKTLYPEKPAELCLHHQMRNRLLFTMEITFLLLYN